MKLISTPFQGKMLLMLIAIISMQCVTNKAWTQGGSVCTNPKSIIYGLTANGAIYPINVNTGIVGSALKNTTYSGNSVQNANGLGYNSVNGKFYYFKRNATSSPEEFVSFDPALNIVTVLASSGASTQTHTGCVTADGTGYYMIDMNANLYYYNIASNTWTKITSAFTDQLGNNVANVIKLQNAGDIAIDGTGSLWIITSSSSNYGVYRLESPLPVESIPYAAVTRLVNPNTATPSGNMIAGIAFNQSGQIFLSTKNDDKLYRLETNLTTTYLSTFSVSDVGNDLTSCNYPIADLPVTWISFDVTLKNNDNAELGWEVNEINNKGFYVQHSKDGTNWDDITFIQSMSDGKVDRVHTYTYTQYNIGAGKHYYRIKQQDIDGKESYSTIKVLNVNSREASVSIWPNPARDNISIQNDGTEGNVFNKARLFDQTGKLIIEKALVPGINFMNMISLNSGMYILQLSGTERNAYTQKIIKQ